MTLEETIFNTAISQGMPVDLANLIVAQARHETGNFTSAVFRDCNNAFGYSAINSAVACPGHAFYKAYGSVQDSTIEVCNWIKRRLAEGKFPDLNTIKSPAEYANLLKAAGYYEDNPVNYAAGLSRWLTYFTAPVVLWPLILIGLFFLIYSARE